MKSLTAMPSEKPNSEKPNEHKIEQMVASSCAQAGGPIRTFPSGTLQIAFPRISAPPKKAGTLSFSTVQSIMNNSQIKVSSATNTNPEVKMGSNSPYTGWNLQDRGAWLQAEGGAIPAVSGARINQNWTGYRGRLADDPSVVLAFEVYDWLRHMYLRPDISSVVAAMQKPLWPTALSGTESHNDIASGLFQLAYAESAQVKYQPTFGFFKVPADGEGDPRDLRNFNEHPEEMRRQFANVFGQNTNAAGTLPAQTLLTSFNEQGNAVTVNGQPGKLLFELMDQMVNTNTMATESMKAAQDASKQKFDEAQREEDILVDLKEQIDRKGELPELVEQFIKHKDLRNAALAKTRRAMNVVTNAHFILTTTLAMLNDRKLISSMGVTKASATDYQILGGDFYPIIKAATVHDILGDQTISTGQDSKVKVTDWAAGPLDGVSQLGVFATTATPAIGNRPTNDTFIQPALAATAVPAQQQNITMFYVDATGNIQSQSPQNSMFGVNILNQQAVYQNTACLITGTSDQDIDLAWNLVDRNNGAFDHGGYWANTADPGYNGTPTSNGIPTLIAEWTMRCPAPQFCKVNGQISSVWMTIGNLKNVIGTADSAGNVTYTYDGKPIGFLETYGQVKLAHNVSVAHLNGVSAGGGQGTYINSLKNDTLDGLAASNGKVKFDVGTPGWFDRFGKPITSSSDTRTGTENWNSTGAVSSGTATSTGELRYMTSIFDTQGRVTNYTYAQLSAYNAAYFTIQQPSGCAQLYFWSS